jgi:hypothetical protein
MSGELNVMVAFAVSRLADDRSPGEAYQDLVGLGTDRRRAAVAVCVAGGTSLEEAERRMLAYDDIWPLLGEGDDASAGDLLELHGYFDREVELDDQWTATVSRLQQAIASAGWLPSGYAVGIGRLLRTGRLREAFLFLESTGAERWPDQAAFWSELYRAGEAWAPDDPEVVAARARCAERAGGQ